MRHHQPRFGQPLTSIQDQIEIKRPRRSRRRPLASLLALDRQQPVQEGTRRQGGLADDHAVQETGLLADADGSGVEPGRAAEMGEMGGQAADREREVGFAITQVAAQGDRDGGECRYCPVQRSPMTTPVWSLMARDVPIRSLLPSAA